MPLRVHSSCSWICWRASTDHEESFIVVPDTNALYWNTDLDKWTLPSGGPFLIALTPTVLDELDHHKADGSNRERQAKASRLIRQISEYRKRGNLVAGVPLLKGVISVFAVAT